MFNLRPYQKEAVRIGVEFFRSPERENGIMVLPTGCHAKGTPILMYDGTMKNVEDIVLGDLLMGDDGTPRKVLRHHRGKDTMFRITPIKGDSFVVNGGHILSLCDPTDKFVMEISVYRYTFQSDSYKSAYKLYKQNKTQFTDFTIEEIGEDEYFGFTLDGNHLYCDGQGFVHHNSGKSLIITSIADELNSNVLVFCPSREITLQNLSKMKKYTDDCSAYSASVGEKRVSKITFAMIGSIKNKVEEFKKFRYIMVDECHGIGSDNADSMYLTFLSMLDCKVLGFTATPFRLTSERYFDYEAKAMRTKNAKLTMLINEDTPFFKKILYVVQVKDLLNQGYLANLKYYSVKPTRWNEEKIYKNTTGSDYSEKSVKFMMEMSDMTTHLISVCRRLLQPKTGVPRKGILVFTQFVEDAEKIANSVHSAAFISGMTTKKNRERILQDFQDGKIKVLANCGVLTCLSADTEILTRDGWKGVDTISENDMIAQYEDENIDFAKPIRIIKKKHSGNFVSCEGRYTNLRVTDDHTILYRKSGVNKLSAERRAKAAELVGQKIYLPISGICEPESIRIEQPTMPCSKNRFINYNAYNYRQRGYSKEEARALAEELYNRKENLRYKNPDELTFDECLFIGFWIGDGTASNGRYSVSQSLRYPRMCEWIESLLNKIGVHYTISRHNDDKLEIINGRICYTHGYNVYNFAKGTGGNGQYVETNLTKLLPYLKKDGTDLFWGFSKEQILAVFYGLFLANGCHGDMQKPRYLAFVTSSKKLLDILQSVCTCRGLRMFISEKKRDIYKKPFYSACVREAKYHQLVNERLELEKNNLPEDVWCVTMPKGTIVTRRGGRVTILGNCGFDFPALDTIVIGRPTLSLAMHYQIVGRALRPFAGKDAWIIDCVGNTQRFGEVGNIYIGESTEGSMETFGWVQDWRTKQFHWKQLTGVFLN